MSDNGQLPPAEPALRLTITPEPTEEEAAAIAAALSVIAVASAQAGGEPEAKKPRSTWTVTGRLAAHHAAPRARQRRWSRTLAWLGRNQ